MIGLLIKNRLSALFGAMVSRGKGGKVNSAPLWKKILIPVLIIALVAFFGFSVTMMFLGIGGLLVPFGGDWLYYSMIMLISVTVTFVLSIFEPKSELFECKDNELLLSMPIKSSDILIARILVVLIYNYLIDAVIMLPALVIYGIYSHNIFGILGGVLAYLLIPVIGVSLASAVGFVVAKISKLFKNKTIVTMVLPQENSCAGKKGLKPAGKHVRMVRDRYPKAQTRAGENNRRRIKPCNTDALEKRT